MSVGMESWKNGITSFKTQSTTIDEKYQPDYKVTRHDIVEQNKATAKAMVDYLRHDQRPKDPQHKRTPKAKWVDIVLKWLVTEAATQDFPLNDIMYMAAWARREGALKNTTYDMTSEDLPHLITMEKWQTTWKDLMAFFKKYRILQIQPLPVAIIMARSLADLETIWHWPLRLRETHSWLGAMTIFQQHMLKLGTKTHLLNDDTKRDLIFPYRLWTHLLKPNDYQEYSKHLIDTTQQLRKEKLDDKLEHVMSANLYTNQGWMDREGKKEIKRILKKNTNLTGGTNKYVQALTGKLVQVAKEFERDNLFRPSPKGQGAPAPKSQPAGGSPTAPV
jgi:hypothetical protein